jgi:hypothetical protein
MSEICDHTYAPIWIKKALYSFNVIAHNVIAQKRYSALRLTIFSVCQIWPKNVRTTLRVNTMDYEQQNMSQNIRVALATK